MEKPTLITLIHKETKVSKPFISYRGYPITDDLCEWVDIGDGKKEKREMWTAYKDTRYKAKLRLWRYITYTKKGKEIPKYSPYSNTEVGKSIGILSDH